VEEVLRRRNTAIDVVAVYCHFQEGGAVAMLYERISTYAKAACSQVDC